MRKKQAEQTGGGLSRRKGGKWWWQARRRTGEFCSVSVPAQVAGAGGDAEAKSKQVQFMNLHFAAHWAKLKVLLP